MTATLRGHAMRKMMVRLLGGVECSAKIAMRALPGWRATTRLLPKHVLQRRIFLERYAARIC